MISTDTKKRIYTDQNVIARTQSEAKGTKQSLLTLSQDKTWHSLRLLRRLGDLAMTKPSLKFKIEARYLLLLALLPALMTGFFLWKNAPQAPIYPKAQLVLEKKDFKVSEKIEFTLNLNDNSLKKTLSPFKDAWAQEEQNQLGLWKEGNTSIEAQIIYNDLEQEKIPLMITRQGDNLFKLSLDPTDSNFRPGQYQVKVTLEKDGNTRDITQDFTWGVLAVNTNKSLYKTHEEAQIYFGVLDEKGTTLCDAQIKVQILNPKSEILNLSTDDGTIQYSGDCARDNFTYVPDYSASYQVDKEGTYQLEVTAETKNGHYTINDSFEVSSDIPFDIERIGPTRINPIYPYNYQIKVKASQDFEGQIEETVPKDFIIEGNGFQVKEENNKKILAWEVNLKKGKTKELSYTFDAPNISPEFFLLGPLKLVQLDPFDQSDKLVFQENRSWQIASDAVANMILLWDDGNSTPSGWTCISCGGGDPFYQRFIRGNTSYGSSQGGSATHAHSDPGTLTLADSADDLGTAGSGNPPKPPANNHTHTTTVSSGLGGNNTPVYRTLRVIRYDLGIPAILPAGVIAFFVDTVPAGWTKVYNDGATPRYIQGDTTVGSTGGANTHTHTLTVNNSSAAGSSTTKGGTSGTAVGNINHTHASTTGNSSSGNNEPPYVNVTLAQKDAMGPISSNVIAMFDNTPPAAWTVKSGVAGTFNAAFPRPSDTSLDTTGGASTHTHASFSFASNTATGGTASYAGSAGGTAFTTPTHTHQITTSLDSQNHLPIYWDAIFAKMTGSAPIANLTQTHYHWFNDDGTSAATADNPYGSLSTSASKRLKIQISNEGDAATTSAQFRIEYGAKVTTCAAASYTDVGAGGGDFDMSNSANMTDGNDTADDAAMNNENPTFITDNNAEKDTSSTVAAMNMTYENVVEPEFSIIPTVSAAGNYCFRITNAGSTNQFTYTTYAEGTVPVGFNISGNIYTNETPTAYDCSGNNLTIAARVNDTGGPFTGTCTASSGAYQINSVVANSGDTITVYINSESVTANTLYVTDGTAKTDVYLYQDRLSLRADTSTITNQKIRYYDNDNNSADMLFTSNLATTYDLTVEPNIELHVWTGDTFDPGGIVTTDATGGVLHLDDSSTAYLDTANSWIKNDVTIDTSSTLNVDANASTSGTLTVTGTLTKSTGTPTLTMGGTSKSISGAGSITFYNLTVAPSASITTAVSPTISNDFTVSSAGSLSASSGTITMSGGSISNSGALTFAGLTVNGTTTTSSSFTVNGALTTGVSGNLSPSGGTITLDTIGWGITNGGTLAFSGLTIAETPSSQPAASFTVNGTLTVGSSKNLSPSGGTITLGTTGWGISNGGTLVFSGLTISESPSAQPTANFSVSGALTVNSTKNLSPSAGTITMTGGSIANSGTLAFNNLTVTGTTTTSSSFTVNGALNVSGGNLSPSGGTVTLATTGWTIANTGTLVFSGLTISETPSSQPTANFSVSGALTVNGTKNLSPTAGTITMTGGSISNSGTLAFNNLTVTGTTTTSSSFTVNGTLNVNAGNLSPSGGTVTMATINWGITNSGTLVFSGLTISETPSAQPTSSFSVSGALTVSSTKNLSPTAGTITMTGGSISNSGTLAFNNLTVTGTTTTSSSFTVNGTLNVNGGNLSPSGGTITMDTINWGITNSGTLVFSGLTISETPTAQPTSSFSVSGALTVNAAKALTPTAGTITMTGGSIVNNNVLTFNNLTITGTTTTSSSFTVNGTLNVNGGNLSPSGGTITMATTGWTIANSGTLVFSGLTISETPSGQSGVSFAVAGALTVNSSKSFIPSSGTITMNNGGSIVNSGGTLTFQNLTIAASASITTASTFTVAVNLLVNSGGTLSTSGGSGTITVNGNATGAGTLTITNGTFDQRVGAAQNFGTTSDAANWTFATLKFTNSSSLSRTITTQTGGSGTITVSTLLQIGNDTPTDAYPTVLDAGNRNWILSATNGTPFDLKTSTNGASSITASTSTFSYTGANAGGDTTVQSTTYYGLTINASDTFNAEGNLVVNDALTVTTGTLAIGTYDLTVGSDTVAGDIAVAGSLTQAASGTTLVKTYLSNTGIVGGAGTISVYNLSLSPTNSGGTIRLGSGASQTITVNGNLTVGNGTNTVTLDVNTNDPNLTLYGNFTLNDNTTWQAGSGTILLDGGTDVSPVTFTDNHGTKQNIGTVQIGTSPGVTNLSSDMTADSLTIASGDKLNTRGYDLDIATFVTVNGTLTATDTVENDGTIINLGTNWTVASTGTFTADESATHETTVIFDHTSAANLDSGGTDENHDFMHLQISKSGAAAVTLANYALHVEGNLQITTANSTLDVSGTNYGVNVGGSYSNSGTFTAQQGTVTFDDTAGSKTLGGTMTGTSAFYNLVFDGVGGGWSFGANAATVSNNLTIPNGTVTAPSSTLTITGNYNNSGGTFTHANGEVIFDAGDTGNTLAGTMTGTSSFYNLTFNNASGAWSFGANSATIANNFTITSTTGVGGVTAPSTTLTIGGNFTKTAGTFTHNSGTVVFNDNSKISTLTYNAAVTFSSFTVSTTSKEIDFDNVDQVNIAGTLTINGGACGTKVKLYSDSAGNQYDLNATGTKSVQFADIKDSYAVAAITATDSKSSGNVTGSWTITGDTCGGVTVSGNAYADEATTAWVPCDGSTTNISLVVNGGTAQTTSCDNTTGAYTFYTVTTAVNNPVSVFFNATNKGVATTVAADGTSNMTLNPRLNRVWVKTETGITSITNANLDHCDSASPAQCSNIPYSVTTNNLTTESGIELHVESSKTYDPGGTVTTNATGGDLHVDDNATAYLDTATSAIGQDVLVDGGATLNIQATATVGGGDITTSGTSATVTYTNTPTLTISGTGGIGGGTTPSITFYDLTISGTQTMNSATTTANDLTVNGTMNGTANVTVNGTIAGTGTITMSGSSTTEQRVTANENFGTTSGTNVWTFPTLLFSNSHASTQYTVTTQGGTGGLTISTLLQVGKAGDTANTVLDAGGRTWTLSGTGGTPFDLVGSSSLTPNTSTFTYTGAYGGGNTTAQTATYHNLTFNASDTFAADGAITVNNDLTVTAGTFALGSYDLTVGSNASYTGDILVATSQSLTQSSAGTTTVKTPNATTAIVGGAGALTFYNLTLAPGVAGGTIQLGSAAGQTITVSNDLTVGDGTNAVTIDANTTDPILDINGNFLINASGTFQASSGSDFTIAKNFTNNGTVSNFVNNAGTVTFDTTSTSDITGAATSPANAVLFNHFICTTPGKTLRFGAGKTIEIDGNFTLTGSAGSKITVKSTVNASQWFINLQGTDTVTHINLQDSGGDSASTTISLDSTNNNWGNNNTTYWVFAVPTIPTRAKAGTRFKAGVRIK